MERSGTTCCLATVEGLWTVNHRGVHFPFSHNHGSVENGYYFNSSHLSFNYLDERLLLLEGSPFSTEPWLWEEGWCMHVWDVLSQPWKAWIFNPMPHHLPGPYENTWRDITTGHLELIYLIRVAKGDGFFPMIWNDLVGNPSEMTFAFLDQIMKSWHLLFWMFNWL